MKHPGSASLGASSCSPSQWGVARRWGPKAAPTVRAQSSATSNPYFDRGGAARRHGERPFDTRAASRAAGPAPEAGRVGFVGAPPPATPCKRRRGRAQRNDRAGAAVTAPSQAIQRPRCRTARRNLPAARGGSRASPVPRRRGASPAPSPPARGAPNRASGLSAAGRSGETSGHTLVGSTTTARSLPRRLPSCSESDISSCLAYLDSHRPMCQSSRPPRCRCCCRNPPHCHSHPR